MFVLLLALISTSHSTPSHFIPSHGIPSHSIRFHTFLFHPIPSRPVPSYRVTSVQTAGEEGMDRLLHKQRRAREHGVARGVPGGGDCRPGGHRRVSRKPLPPLQGGATRDLGAAGLPPRRRPTHGPLPFLEQVTQLEGTEHWFVTFV